MRSLKTRGGEQKTGSPSGGYRYGLRNVSKRHQPQSMRFHAISHKKEIKRILLAKLSINGCGPMYLRVVSFIAFGIA